MNIQVVKIKDIKSNPSNPRVIKDEKFQKLCESIKAFPKMLELRPIVVNDDMVVLGGNMRLKALTHIGLKEAPVIKASDLTEEQQRQFIIKDNVGFGEWDWDLLANDWDSSEAEEWGLDVWQPPTDADYSILDDLDVDDEMSTMEDGVKKAIQIEFDVEHYPEAQEIIKFWREREAYIGGMILEHLREEKNKL